MANVKSAEKRNRQNLKRRARHSAVRSSVKTAAAKTAAVIRSDVKAATESLRATTSVLAKAAHRGSIPKTRMARKISRLQKALNKAAGSKSA